MCSLPAVPARTPGPRHARACDHTCLAAKQPPALQSMCPAPTAPTVHQRRHLQQLFTGKFTAAVSSAGLQLSVSYYLYHHPAQQPWHFSVAWRRAGACQHYWCMPRRPASGGWCVAHCSPTLPPLLAPAGRGNHPSLQAVDGCWQAKAPTQPTLTVPRTPLIFLDLSGVSAWALPAGGPKRACLVRCLSHRRRAALPYGGRLCSWWALVWSLASWCHAVVRMDARCAVAAGCAPAQLVWLCVSAEAQP
jgi:hypothetical protein